MARPVALLLFLPLAAMALAGCAVCEDGPPVSARGIDRGDDRAGSGPFDLDLLVIDAHDGAPLEGAGAVVYWGGARVADWDAPVIVVGPGVVIVAPSPDDDTTEPDKVLRMRTAADGTAHARTDAERILGVVAAKPGYTEEWLPAVAAGGRGDRGSLTVPLYREHLDVAYEDTWSPGGVSTAFLTGAGYLWQATELPFGGSTDLNRGYSSRVVEMRITLRWSNEVTDFGNLGLGLGPSASDMTMFLDGELNLGAGAQQQTWTVTTQDIVEHGLSDSVIHIGPASEVGYFGPLGLDYEMQVAADFDSAFAAFSRCGTFDRSDDDDGLGVGVPGPGTALTAGVILAAALVASVVGNRRLQYGSVICNDSLNLR